MKRNGIFVAVALLAAIAFAGGAQAAIDLNVTSIDINPAVTSSVVDVVFINQINNITAVVTNTGADPAGAFDVCFKDDTNGVNIGTVRVIGGLAASASKTVYVNDWTPTCTDYPTVMPGHPCTSMAATINVTVDCDSEVDESDEGNNTLLKPLPAIQQWTKTGTCAGTYDVTAGVVNNGYRSKNFDCNATEEPLSQFEYYGTITGGGIDYNVSGAKNYPFDGGETDARTHTITIPDSATVKEARLYVYWYDYFYSFDTSNAPESGALADISVNFTGNGWQNFTTPDASYTDQKGYAQYNSPKGTYAYDVTSLVTGSGDYDVTVTNIDPNGNKTTLLGEMLVVVYETPGAHKTMQLWMLEGNDYQSGREYYGSSTTEATATVTFPGNVNLATATSATLVSVVAQGQTSGMNMLFNGGVIKTDAWDSDTEAYPSSKIDVESVDVTSSLAASNNNMGFQDTGTAGMQASNAFLIVCTDTQNVSACNSSGIEWRSFLVGEDVYVMGSGLAVGNYLAYIQSDPVELGDALDSNSDPSTTQEWINITVADACFGPTKIWSSIPGPVSYAEYDIILDKYDDGADTGDYSANDGIASACTAGIVAPVPELATFTLVGIGLMMFAGVVYRRKE